tara:strand:- start:1836 stop:2669 length:834 start_codon:yes stop_codon:yes gene_type:complete
MNSTYTDAENILSYRTSEYTSTEDSIVNEVKTDIEATEEVTTVAEPEAEAISEYLEVKSEIKIAEDMPNAEEEGTFEGYASVFENTDLGNDVIKTGAFKKSLRKRGYKGVKLLYQHKSDMPIGVFDSIKEDDNGLYVKGRLALKTTAGRDAYELLKMGALDAMSIGFRANPQEISYDKRSQKRNIGEVDLLEISLVTFPMNPQALIRSVKANEISIREWEKGMRDAFVISRSEAKVAAKAVYQMFEAKANSETLEELDKNVEMVNAIKNLTLTLKTS